MMTKDRILVAGLGNIFRGDDAFGVEVVQCLTVHRLPSSVRVIDFGTRGYDFAFALCDGYDLVIIVDAVQRGGIPGSVFLIEPDVTQLERLPQDEWSDQAHDMNPLAALRLTKSLGAEVPRMLLVGCEPKSLGDEYSGQMGLTDTCRVAIDEAIELILSVVDDATVSETADR